LKLADKGFGLKVLQNWWPEVTELKRVIFEYAPEERYTTDNSAFDVAFEVSAGGQSGLIGLEWKVQRLDLKWEQREWTMLLWARYCGTILSDAVNSQIEGK
jgi:hypothetical protein